MNHNRILKRSAESGRATGDSDSRGLVAGSRLYALWNRSAGDCLPDALCQAAYGVSDRDNVLRAALGATLQHAPRAFLARWTAWERLQVGVAPPRRL